MRFNAEWDKSKFGEGFVGMTKRMRQIMPLYFHNFSRQVEAFMKSNAPWTDRTGEARRSLSMSFHKEGDVYVSEGGQGVWYGVYIENNYGSKYSILKPTFYKFLPQFEREVMGIMQGSIYNRG